MGRNDSLERIREDIHARQKATVWPDSLRNGRTIDAFLWKGDPKAKPIQRAGLVGFALFFLLIAVIDASIPFEKHFEGGTVLAFFMALLVFLLSMRLLRNAFLRPPKHTGDDETAN